MIYRLVPQQNLNLWFADRQSLFTEMGYEEILKDPRRFLNFDETSIHLGFINKLSYNSWKKEERQNNEHKEFNEIQEE